MEAIHTYPENDSRPHALAGFQCPCRPLVMPIEGGEYDYHVIHNSFDGRELREPDAKTFTCPVCGMTSYNANDVRYGYCGNCCKFTGTPSAL